MAETKLTINEMFPNNLPGWNAFALTCTYATADSPTFTFTVAGDVTKILYPGVKVQLTQTTVKYFIVTASAYSAPNTTITVYGGTDFTLANAAISAVYYSREKAPYGFPLDPAKWSITVLNAASDASGSPATGAVTNLGSVSIDVPIGIWDLVAVVSFRINGGTYKQGVVAISTANNSLSDIQAAGFMLGGINAAYMACPFTLHKRVTLAAKTTHYIVMRQDCDATSCSFANNSANELFRATCAYL